MKIVLATNNRGKIEEIKDILKDVHVEICTLDDFPGLTLPPEDMWNFKGNALKKAHFAALNTGITAVADDSGLSIDALWGRPGVLSARYAGDGATDYDNYMKLLGELEGTPDRERTGRFICVIAVVTLDGKEKTFEGILEGAI
ncbi:MAG: non-canonical purine NTP pyrophosphatase, partial [Deltaproteobacteria bacterium]|nr:non-canonical purine NTP pyrophosphatase [Deltaproteobacteria bacterium]